MQRLLIAVLLLALPAIAYGEPEASWQGKSVPHWIVQLSADEVQTRWYATYALGQIGAATGETADLVPAIGPLTEILADPDRVQYEYVRGGAAWALGQIGPMADDQLATRNVVEQLIEALGSQLVSVRRNAPAALGNFGDAATPAVDRLVQLLGDDDVVVRVNSAVALWKIQQYPQSVTILAQLARGGDPTGAFAAVEALGRIGTDSDAALPVLVQALGHRDADVRRAAARALGRFGAAAVPALREPLFGPDAQSRRSATEALGWIGPRAIAALLVVLKNEDPAVRRVAARALGRMGGEAKRAESALVEAVGDNDRQVQEAAASALKKIRATDGP